MKLLLTVLIPAAAYVSATEEPDFFPLSPADELNASDDQNGSSLPCTLGCQNGAACLVGTTDSSYSLASIGNTTSYCECLAGFWGDLCELVKDQDQTSERPDIDTCGIKCLNNGTCEMSDDGEPFCLCPSNAYGDFCENTGVQCGNNYCQHTSKCFEIHLADGSSEYICDCTSAFTKETYYAGEFCQYPSTQFCSGADDPNGRQFCVNDGECPQESYQACVCPEGFIGPRCAFQIGVDGSDYTECELPCQNRGTCQKGLKNAFKSESFEKFDLDIAHILDTHGQQHENYEHCVCPEGYFGIRCEYQMEECGEGEHLCFHGSVCVRYGDVFGCDCESSDLKTAGLFCENVATSECEQWVDSENGHRGFCTNGGKCTVDSAG
jgi:hypothetical protein